MRAIHFSTFAAAAILLSVRFSLAAEPAPKAPAANEAAKNAAAKPRITISKETTYITEPLRPDGYPDYVAAINQRMSEGVTSENNAAVPMLQAIGPKEISEQIRDRVYRELGMTPLPAEGKYFVSQTEIIRRWKTSHPRPEPQPQSDDAADPDADLWEQFEKVTLKPWKVEEFPLPAEWLKVNERALELAEEAARRPRYFWPVIPEGQSGMFSSVFLTVNMMSRDLAQLLQARAMRRTGSGDLEGAWHDVLTCHRIARLVGQGPWLVDGLVCYAVDALATHTNCSFAHAARPSRAQAEKMQADLRGLPPSPNMTEELDFGERMLFLDTVTLFAKDGPNGLHTFLNILGQAHGEGADSLGELLERALIIVDWNVPLRMGNEWYDRIVAIGKIADRQERARQMGKFEEDRQNLVAEAKDPHSLFRDFFTKRTPEELFSSRVAGLLVGESMIGGSILRAEDRFALNNQMEDTSLALAAYRADNGQYPGKLESLVPKYLAKVPVDTFAKEKAPIRYRREGEAYVLWTVHLNGVDDNGRTQEDDPAGDDYVLRPVPAKKPAAPNSQ